MKKEFFEISKLLKKNSKVLDVGCGDGELMKYITENITENVRGLEISKNNIQKCIAKGLTVIEGDDPENVINELLRVGKKAIVSIPNFGHWRVRLNLLFKGQMPITENLPNEWYNTPNLHMCTIRDFVNFCNKKKIKIDCPNLFYVNLFSELGIFIIEK